MSVKTNDDGSVTVDLSFPIAGPDGPLSAVTLRRVRGADLRKMATNGHDRFWLLSQVSGVAGVFVDLMDGSDLNRLMKVVEGFLEPSPETGEAS